MFTIRKYRAYFNLPVERAYAVAGRAANSINRCPRSLAQVCLPNASMDSRPATQRYPGTDRRIQEFMISP
jgi:hypothetical protein